MLVFAEVEGLQAGVPLQPVPYLGAPVRHGPRSDLAPNALARALRPYHGRLYPRANTLLRRAGGGEVERVRVCVFLTLC